MQQTVILSKYELPWETWQIICVQFSFDPYKTKNIWLNVSEARVIN